MVHVYTLPSGLYHQQNRANPFQPMSMALLRHRGDGSPRLTPCVRSCLVSMSPAPRLFAAPLTAPFRASMTENLYKDYWCAS